MMVHIEMRERFHTLFFGTAAFSAVFYEEIIWAIFRTVSFQFSDICDM